MSNLSPPQFDQLNQLRRKNYSISNSGIGGYDEPSWGSVANFHEDRVRAFSPETGYPGQPALVAEHRRLATQARGIQSKEVLAGAGPTPEERAGQAHLPGMDRFDVADLHPANSRLPKDHADYLATPKEWEAQRFESMHRMKNRDATGPVKDHWSGPDSGQMIMGVHNLGSNNGQLDPHGFVHEPSENEHWAADTTHRVGANFASPDTDNGEIRAKQFYKSVGGAKKDSPDVRAHWNNQPTQQVRADQIIHTGQYHDLETEKGHSGALVMNNVPEGRARINTLRTSMGNTGFDENKPAWLIKHNDRLYALDGHHRIVAAREAGLSHFPAKVWDRDAEQKQQNLGQQFQGTGEALHKAAMHREIVAGMVRDMPRRVPGVDPHAIISAKPTPAALRGEFGF